MQIGKRCDNIELVRESAADVLFVTPAVAVLLIASAAVSRSFIHRKNPDILWSARAEIERKRVGGERQRKVYRVQVFGTLGRYQGRER